MVIRKVRGHGLARLAGALLEAHGYKVYVGPPGPDGGLDIRASPPPGFGAPRICVQVKSGATPASSPDVQHLVGSMTSTGADHGLFLSWSGFKRGVAREWAAAQFFKIRLWDQCSFVDELLDHYDDLDSESKAELPLKHIWTVVPEREQEAAMA